MSGTQRALKTHECALTAPYRPAASVPHNGRGHLVGVVSLLGYWKEFVSHQGLLGAGPGSLSLGPGLEYLSPRNRAGRSEEHTTELQSRQYLVCSLLLEKKY